MQFEWNSKDKISFGLYKELVESKTAQFYIWLESENKEINLVDIRTGNAEYRFNNFVINENSDDNTITFCPNIAGCPAYFRVNSSDSFRLKLTRKDGGVEDESTFEPGETKLELTPSGMRMYNVNVAGNRSSAQEIVDDNIGKVSAVQEESIPEFFGGSFSSTSEPQHTVTSDAASSNVKNNPIEDTNIFVGGFSSDSAPKTNPDTDIETYQKNNNQQAVQSASSSAIPLFADMFPTSGSRQNSDNQNQPEPKTQTEADNNIDKGQENTSDTGFPSSPFDFQHKASDEDATKLTSSVSGFSVPYVETEGIRERKEKVQTIQQDNDRTALEVENLDKQIAELENRSRQLSDSKSSLISHLEVLQQEYDKDYSKFQADIEEIKGRYSVDQSVLDFYKDKDPVPIEELLKQTDELVSRVEEQIRLFVTAQQNKSDEIEKSLKVGKKE